MNGQDGEFVAVPYMSVDEIHPPGQAPLGARSTPIPPEFEDHPLASEIPRLDLFRDTAGVSDLPRRGRLAEQLRKLRELEPDLAEVDRLSCFERDFSHVIEVARFSPADLIAAGGQLDRERPGARTSSGDCQPFAADGPSDIRIVGESICAFGNVPDARFGQRRQAHVKRFLGRGGKHRRHGSLCSRGVDDHQRGVAIVQLEFEQEAAVLPGRRRLLRLQPTPLLGEPPIGDSRSGNRISLTVDDPPRHLHDRGCVGARRDRQKERRDSPSHDHLGDLPILSLPNST